jgi:hypothetical protein
VSGTGLNRANMDQRGSRMRNGDAEIRLNYRAEPEWPMAVDLILKLATFGFLLAVFVYAFAINL